MPVFADVFLHPGAEPGQASFARRGAARKQPWEGFQRRLMVEPDELLHLFPRKPVADFRSDRLFKGADEQVFRIEHQPVHIKNCVGKFHMIRSF